MMLLPFLILLGEFLVASGHLSGMSDLDTRRGNCISCIKLPDMYSDGIRFSLDTSIAAQSGCEAINLLCSCKDSAECYFSFYADQNFTNYIERERFKHSGPISLTAECADSAGKWLAVSDVSYLEFASVSCGPPPRCWIHEQCPLDELCIAHSCVPRTDAPDYLPENNPAQVAPVENSDVVLIAPDGRTALNGAGRSARRETDRCSRCGFPPIASNGIDHFHSVFRIEEPRECFDTNLTCFCSPHLEQCELYLFSGPYDLSVYLHYWDAEVGKEISIRTRCLDDPDHKWEAEFPNGTIVPFQFASCGPNPEYNTCDTDEDCDEEAECVVSRCIAKMDLVGCKETKECPKHDGFSYVCYMNKCRIVLRAPDEPEDLSVTGMSENHVVLQWRRPNTADIHIVENYDVKCVKNFVHEIQCDKELMELRRPYVVTVIWNLEPGTEYMFLVNAKNVAGESNFVYLHLRTNGTARSSKSSDGFRARKSYPLYLPYNDGIVAPYSTGGYVYKSDNADTPAPASWEYSDEKTEEQKSADIQEEEDEDYLVGYEVNFEQGPASPERIPSGRYRRHAPQRVELQTKKGRPNLESLLRVKRLEKLCEIFRQKATRQDIYASLLKQFRCNDGSFTSAMHDGNDI